MSDVRALIIVQPGDLRAIWPMVRDRLAATIADCGEPIVQEDVFHEILVGNAYLWATEEAGAFVVLQIRAGTNTRDLHIWLAGESTVARAADYWPQLLEIAAEAGCSRITFESPRRWERALPGLSVRYLYTCDVN